MLMTDDLVGSGFGLAPTVFDADDVAEAGTEVDRLIAQWRENKSDRDCRWFITEDTGQDVLFRIHNLHRKHPVFSRLISQPRFGDLVRSVIPDGAVPTQCALIYKQPRVGRAFAWHRDPIDVPANTVYNFSIFLDPSTDDNGALGFVPGSHVDGTERPQFAPQRPAGVVYVSARPGDVLIHDVRVYHGSDACVSEQQRRSVIWEFQPLRLRPRSIVKAGWIF